MCSLLWAARPSYSELRYFDGRGSGTTADDIEDSDKLLVLKLPYCQLTKFEILIFPDLLYLDLSHNNLTTVSWKHLFFLTNLREIRLGWNPITDMTQFTERPITQWIRLLDISGIDLQEKLPQILNRTNPRLEVLNVSYSSLTTLVGTSFSAMPRLRVLDLKGNRIEQFDERVFTGMKALSELYTDNPKLCCSQLLPDRPKHCFSEVDELSSCANLLRSNLYRGILWLFAMASLVGNASSLFSRVVNYKASSKTGKVAFFFIKNYQ